MQSYAPQIPLRNDPCIACGETTPPQSLFIVKGFSIVRCTTCGLGRTAVPPGFDPANIYTREYFQGGQEDGYADYVGSRDELSSEFRNLLADIAFSGVSKGKLLEVGCAYGFFLDEARRLFDVGGIELAEDAVAACRARGLDVVQYADTAFYTRRGPLDIVVMLDVIEHLVDPGAILRDLRKHARPGALLVLTTGDFASFMSRSLRGQWRLMTPPQHLWFFTRNAIKQLLIQHEFRVTEITYPTKQVPMGLIAYQIARYLKLQHLTRGRMVRGTIPVNLHDAMRVFAVRV